MSIEKKMARRLALVAVLVFSLSNAALADDAPGRIGFVAKNLMATADGVFHSWKFVDTDVMASALEKGSVTIEIDVASLDTDNKRRDDHLRTEDFFEVERWPTARVRVHDAKPAEGGRWTAQFDLEIRDQRKTVPGTFEVVSTSPLSVKGELTINRMEFGVGTPKTWNPLSITEEIPIRFEATLPN